MEVLNLFEKYGIAERKIFMLGEYWNQKNPIIPIHYIVLDRYSGKDDYAVTFTSDWDDENTGESVRATWFEVKEVLLAAEAIRTDAMDEDEVPGKLKAIKWREIDGLILEQNTSNCKQAYAERDHVKTDTIKIIDDALVKLREAGSRTELIQKNIVASENIFLAIKFLNIAVNQIKEEEVKK